MNLGHGWGGGYGFGGHGGGGGGYYNSETNHTESSEVIKYRGRASHIILYYFKALTPKQVHNTRKTLHFLQANFHIDLEFFKLINSSLIF